MIPILNLDNESGENLHVCPTGRGGLWIVTHDGTEGGSYEATEEDVVRLIAKLGVWVRNGGADQL